MATHWQLLCTTQTRTIFGDLRQCRGQRLKTFSIFFFYCSWAQDCNTTGHLNEKCATPVPFFFFLFSFCPRLHLVLLKSSQWGKCRGDVHIPWDVELDHLFFLARPSQKMRSSGRAYTELGPFERPVNGNKKKTLPYAFTSVPPSCTEYIYTCTSAPASNPTSTATCQPPPPSPHSPLITEPHRDPRTHDGPPQWRTHPRRKTPNKDHGQWFMVRGPCVPSYPGRQRGVANPRDCAVMLGGGRNLDKAGAPVCGRSGRIVVALWDVCVRACTM